ncbi:MAG: sigma-70 family RNA polymerase sigma factor [Deltaproteobacteria bacterium]|nr:sigma-70 family RNA polymerase sigma factor [Deltaproteobacteria bacterium]
MQPSASRSDAVLLQAWAEGDGVAGEELVDRHFDLVYRFVASIAGGSPEVSDLVQRTFVACIERRDDLGKIERFRPYVLGVARNQVRMHLRHARVRAGERLVEDPQEYARASWNPNLSSVAARREQQRLMLMALRKLPLQLQLPLELHYWEGLTMQEIGALLDLHPGTIKKRLFVARKRLAEWMAQLASDDATAQLSLSQFDQWASAMRALADGHREA